MNQITIQAIVTRYRMQRRIIQRQLAVSIKAVKHACNITQSLATSCQQIFLRRGRVPAHSAVVHSVEHSVSCEHVGPPSTERLCSKLCLLGARRPSKHRVSWEHVGQPSTERLCSKLCLLGARRPSKHRGTESASNDEPRCSQESSSPQESSCLAPI